MIGNSTCIIGEINNLRFKKIKCVRNLTMLHTTTENAKRDNGGLWEILLWVKYESLGLSFVLNSSTSELTYLKWPISCPDFSEF